MHVPLASFGHPSHASKIQGGLGDWFPRKDKKCCSAGMRTLKPDEPRFCPGTRARSTGNPSFSSFLNFLIYFFFQLIKFDYRSFAGCRGWEEDFRNQRGASVPVPG